MIGRLTFAQDIAVVKMSTIPTDDSSSLQPNIVFLRPKADRRQVKDRRRTARGGRRVLDGPSQLDSSNKEALPAIRRHGSG
jgi:hypothetical protein